jgi:curved DNA-binding protein
LQRTEPDHYATLGLDHRCTLEQIRSAYRLLAKRHHPDLNPGSSEAAARTRALNSAHETLSDPERREAYDRELAAARKSTRPARGSKADRNLSQEVHLRIEDFLLGTTLEVRVNDPSNPNGPETYPLAIPPETAPGARFRVPRAEGGFVLVRVRVRPDFRFKVRGSDLRCDLKIKSERAVQGGTETVRGIHGTQLRVSIPRGAARGETIRIAGEGLPKPRGGRGDLLVRITYRVDVRIRKSTGR